nr:MAG TPA: Mitochondrial complex I, 51 kDa:ubiquinone, oxidoreductase, complex I, mammalian [Caudoviricetes sp.]
MGLWHIRKVRISISPWDNSNRIRLPGSSYWDMS